MSEKAPAAAKAETPSVEAPVVESPPVEAPAVENVKAKRPPGYSNPAFKAMGIPPIRLPSRNWMIFWCVVSAGIGGYAYDRYQVKQVRKKWMERVAHYADVPLPPNVTARKVMVYVAPPPNDYLDESLTVFRRYVKPVLNAGGVDFEIKSENRQGVIRSLVAAEVRALRREMLEAQKLKEQSEREKKWYNRVKHWFSKSKPAELTQEEQHKAAAAEFNYKNLLGVYYKNKQWTEAEIINEDAFVSDPAAHGGVICIGRGAYKEYLTGLHEGLLGPLEKPLDHTEFEEKKNTKAEKVEEETPKVETSAIVAPEVKPLDDIVNLEKPLDDAKLEVVETKPESDTPAAAADQADEKKEDDKKEETDDEDVDENGEKRLPVPKPFITPSEYSKAAYAPEFPSSGPVKTKSNVAAVFQQPILVIPVYHLLGFLQMPWRIYRFYNNRSYAEEYGRAACAVVENLRTRFKLDDVDWAKDEEDDWPKKWVAKGKEKGSEWTQELVVDERVVEKLWVYDAGAVGEKNVEKKN